MSVAKVIAQTAFHRLGGIAMVRTRNRGLNRILMYHNFRLDRVETARQFAAQCEHLVRYYKPVSVSDIAVGLRGDHALPANAFAVTVDDGYRDFYVLAWPILQQYCIPATVYLMTDFLDGLTWPWWDQVRYAFERTPLETVTIRLREEVRTPVLRTPADRSSSYEQVVEQLKLVPNQDRIRFIASLPETLQVDIPVKPPQGLEPLTWAEVRQMASSGVEFGAHTKTHPILSSVETEQELREEIEGSARRLEEELGARPRHFCYPNGRLEDIRDRARRIVEDYGFETAVTTERGFNDQKADRLLLRRIGAEPGDPPYYFQQQAAGFRI